MTLQPGEHVDRYVVESVLGEGGMAVVYRVRHDKLGTPHALKVLSIANKGIQARLLQEGRVQATLRHPNVVAVTDVLEIGGAPALLMEYIEGPPLDAWLQRYQPTLDEALALFRGIVDGVRHAHDKGLIHRDLKPANVMLQPTPAGIVPKVTDFGLAKAVQGEGAGLKRTRTGTTMGTPAYMAPEQIRDASSVDRRADVYSLGCILYELVCGRPPFDAPDILALFALVSAGDWRPAKEVVPDLPDEIGRAIEHALHLEPSARTPDCASLLAEIDGDRPALPVAPRAHSLGEVLGPTSGAAAAVAALTRGPDDGPQPAGATLAPDFGESRAPAETLRTWTASLPADEASAPPPRPRATTLAIAGLAATSLLLAATTIGLGAVWYTSAGDPAADGALTGAEPGPEPPPVAPDPAPTQVEVEPPPAEAEPVEAVAEPPPPPAETPRPRKEPVREAAPAEPPAPPPATGATVTHTGDARSVWLYAGDARYPAGPVPAGTYDVMAWFEGPDPVPAGKVTVTAGEKVELRCSAGFQQCRRP